MSNRAPIKVVCEGDEERIEPTVGGVGTTFLRLLEPHGGLWIAWNGGQKTPPRLSLPAEHPRFDLSFVELGERDVSQYYYGMCNRALWPLMHFMISNCHFNVGPMAAISRCQRNVCGLRDRAGRPWRCAVDPGFPSRADAANHPRAPQGSRDRNFLACALPSGRAVSSVPMAARTVDGNARQRSDRLPLRFVRHAFSQFVPESSRRANR